MTDKQIIIKEITECGFYCAKEDIERLYIYEVIKNTDEEWLKETPEQTLLIDEWIYDYTDCDDRKVYTTSGNLIAVCNDSATCKVYKIEDTKYKIYGNNGLFLIEDKPTYKEALKRKEQECEELKIYIESNEQQVKEVETLVMDNDRLINELGQLKAQLLDQEAETLKAGGIIEALTKENEQLKKQACGLRLELKYIIDKTCCKYNINAKYYHEKIIEIINNLDKYNQTLTEIKEIAKSEIDSKEFMVVQCMLNGSVDNKNKVLEQILQKISEVEGEHN